MSVLSGVRIVEFQGLGPGPFCGMLLADLGADVILVERPENAGAGPARLFNRGKRSIGLDPKNPAARAAAITICARADALIEGLRPGVMERLELGPDVLMAANPKLVYGRLTGWGQTGPLAQSAGHDINYASLSGAAWYSGQAGAAPVPPPTMVGDIGGGALYLAIGILSGVLKARETGKGTVVDAAIVDGSAHMMALLMSMAPSGNTVTERGQSLLDGAHWCRTYACADGEWLSVQCLEPKFHAEFLSLMGLKDDPAFAEQYDRAQWPGQCARLAAIFAEKPVAHWTALFEGSDACVAPVLSPEAAAQDPHMQARATWSEAGGTLQPAPAPRFDDAVPTPAAPPARGADSDAIRKELDERGLI